MAKQRQQGLAAFQVSVREEENLVRIGLSGDASITDVQKLRLARVSFETSHLPILIVDDGLTYIDTVIYGALVQWAQAVRNRNVGWVMAMAKDGAARVFQMAGMNPSDILYPTEEAARAALDRGKPGQRVTVPSRAALALEGLRPK